MSFPESWNAFAHAATAWLGTYLLHSSVLLGLAWLATRPVASVRGREVLWRAALFGGFATAALSVGLGHRPTLGTLDLAALSGSSEAVAAHDAAPALPVDFEALDAALSLAPVAAPAPSPTVEAHRVGPVALALGGSFALASLLLGAWILDRRRRGQIELSEGVIAEDLHALTADHPRLGRVALFLCPTSDTPHATGLFRPRIVVPERALIELSREEQRAMLAHELAHLERRDPLWLGLARATQLFMPLQPLNALARRRLAACSEFLCDARAVERTEDRVALARSLARVAAWIVAEDALPDAACAMANRRSLLGERVERILDEEAANAVNPLVPRSVALAALVGTAVAAPAIVTSPTPDGLPLGPIATGSALTDLAFGGEPAVELTDVTNEESPRDLREALHLLAVELTSELDALDAEIGELRSLAATRALTPAAAERLSQLEQGLRTVRGQEMRIRALLEGAALRGVEAPRNPFPASEEAIPVEETR